MAEAVTLSIAFFGGLISFFSPCILPLIPAYLSNISGTSVMELEKQKSLQKKVFVNSLFFVLGFSLIFISLGLLLGVLSQSAETFLSFRFWLSKIGGLIIIAFGLITLFNIRVPFLEVEHRLRIQVKNTNYFSSSILGASFGAGWTPCFGPIFISILTLVGTTAASILEGGLFLSVYSLGLAIPFLITGAFTSRVSNLIQRANRFYGIVNIISGILLIGLGIIVFTENVSRFLGYILPAGIPFLG